MDDLVSDQSHHEGAPEPARRDAEEWLEAVKDAGRRGELLLAVDLAERGLAEHPGHLWLKHRAVLSLARSGSTAEAARRFDEYGLDAAEDEDVVALGARIAKDEALGVEGIERRHRAARAARRYRAIFDRTRGYYPAINAATLSLIAGEPGPAKALAREVLDLLAGASEESYYATATEAEAHLVLGDEAAAVAALERAATMNNEDYGALATTRRQLRAICGVAGFDSKLLSALSGPGVAHYCGHRIACEGEGGRFPADAEDEVARGMAEELDQHHLGYAYGSLASGADILWAEALVRRGCELHVVLPFALEEFVRRSVAPSGSAWVDRFHQCLTRARDVRFATDDAVLDDDVLYRYGTELAMGLALLRARYLDAGARQFAVWDGGPAGGNAGTAIDVAAWRGVGLKTSVIAPSRNGRSPVNVEPMGAEQSGRVVRAMLFADLKGFSKLNDEELPRFAEHILGAFARVLDRHGHAIQYRNTWGDALYVVLDNARSASACALDLQFAMADLDLDAAGLPGHLALRLSAHIGPVFPTHDPILNELSFLGSHVSRTARIEPVTPPGAVYVTEPFAAALALDGQGEFSCDYVGHMPAAKDFGRLRMYRLRRRVPVESEARRPIVTSDLVR
jgi:class 3 adenylate cyclase/tetratricopeptide (TPR) repeat protein